MTDFSTLGTGELAGKMGIVLIEHTAERTSATMPVAGNRQPFGLLHGGASAVLAETLGSVHAALLAPAGRMPVGTDLNCTHHRAMTDGTVVGVSTPAHVGRTMATFEIVVSDENHRRICTARLTCAYIDAGRARPAGS
jgi:uncharacterized protein (TIGR00369 family)